MLLLLRRLSLYQRRHLAPFSRVVSLHERARRLQGRYVLHMLLRLCEHRCAHRRNWPYTCTCLIQSRTSGNTCSWVSSWLLVDLIPPAHFMSSPHSHSVASWAAAAVWPAAASVAAAHTWTSLPAFLASPWLRSRVAQALSDEKPRQPFSAHSAHRLRDHIAYIVHCRVQVGLCVPVFSVFSRTAPAAILTARLTRSR